MTQPGQTSESKQAVPERAGARVRLALAALLIVAVALGGGIWLAHHVDLDSAALTTVERAELPAEQGKNASDRSSEAAKEAADEPEVADETETTEAVGTPDAPAAADMPDGADSSDASVDEPAAAAPTPQAAPGAQTLTVEEGYSVAEAKPEAEPVQTGAEAGSQQSSPTSSSSQPQSQPQSQSQREQQTTPSAQPTPQEQPTPAQPQTIGVSVSVDGSAAGFSSWTKSLSLSPGSTVYDALVAADGAVNARSTGYGIYVVAIDGLAEKEHGSTSGWMYAVNGIYPNTACSNYVLKDGDSVRWVYVNVDY